MATTTGLGNKRKLLRAKRRLMVKYGTTSPDRSGFTKNLSDTGLFVHTNNVFPPGTTIQVQIHFPDRVFSHWARVIWAKRVPAQLAHLVECGMGVCFIDPPSDWLDYYKSWAGKAGVR